MNGLRVIFQREINAYLRSSVGYVVAATVLMLNGLLFYTQALGPEAEARVSGQVLAIFFYTASGLTVIASLVLSVRLIAEERQLGTQVLLNTSPVRVWGDCSRQVLGRTSFHHGHHAHYAIHAADDPRKGKVSITQILVG
ncbi:MAG: hypothetical protein Ct9H300mP15_27070 [Gemmatimonadota bacterium]|nr:MAG: hypothetical protein Ct9H300mP15_27070 [Gemmatimonadota bacterium]